MAIQKSTTLRNAELDAGESTIGTTPVLKIFTGSAPANCGAANTGTELVSIDLPSDWAAAASSGSKAKSGTWQDVGIGDGDAGHWRLYASNGTTCHMQGTCGASGSGADMILDNVSIATGQTVTVSTFTRTAGGA